MAQSPIPPNARDAGPGFDAAATAAALGRIDGLVVDGLTKGFPGHLGPTALGDIGGLGLNILRGDTPFPAAVIHRSAVEHNGRWMRQFLDFTGADLAPHGKTTMSPHLFALQAENGCWGLTVATMQQATVAAEAGCRRILMANQLVSRADMAALKALQARHPALEYFCYVDSAAGAERLARLAREHGPAAPIRVLLEIGHDGGRTGCRTVAEAEATAAAVIASAGRLVLAGLACFEGLVKSDDLGSAAQKVGKLMDFLSTVAAAADRLGAFARDEILLSAGGSAFFDIVMRRLTEIKLSRPTRVVIRSGCYLTHDSKSYDLAFDDILHRIPESWRRLGRLRPALFVWSMVQSRPEPGLAIVTMGKRDVSFDVDLPTPVLHFRPGTATAPKPIGTDWTISGMNDQHGHLRLPEGADVAIGDLIACGVSHPCTTFDRWQTIYLVDDAYDVTGAIRTFF